MGYFPVSCLYCGKYGDEGWYIDELDKTLIICPDCYEKMTQSRNLMEKAEICALCGKTEHYEQYGCVGDLS